MVVVKFDSKAKRDNVFIKDKDNKEGGSTYSKMQKIKEFHEQADLMKKGTIVKDYTPVFYLDSCIEELSLSNKEKGLTPEVLRQQIPKNPKPDDFF
jgi:hypothetical protein